MGPPLMSKVPTHYYLHLPEESIQAQSCCHLLKVAKSGCRAWQLVPKPRLCYDLQTQFLSSLTVPLPCPRPRGGPGDFFLQAGGTQPCLPRGTSGSPRAGAGPSGRVGRIRGRYLLTDGRPHICLSLKPRWIGFLDVYLSLRSRALGRQ